MDVTSEVFRSAFNSIISYSAINTDGLRELISYIGYVHDLADFLVKSGFGGDIPFIKALSENVLNIANANKKWPDIKPPYSVPNDANEALMKFFDATVNIYPGIGKFGAMTMAIYTLRNALAEYAEVIYPNLNEAVSKLNGVLGLSHIKVKGVGLRLIGYPDYPRYMYVSDTTINTALVSSVMNTVAKSVISALVSNPNRAITLLVDYDKSCKKSLGGAISCLLNAVKRLWVTTISLPNNYVIDDRVRKYIISGLDGEVRLFEMPYSVRPELKVTLKVRPCNRAYLIKYANDIFMGNLELAIIRASTGYYCALLGLVDL